MSMKGGEGAKGDIKMSKRATAEEKREWVERRDSFQDKADYVLRTRDVTRAEMHALWGEMRMLIHDSYDTLGLIGRSRDFKAQYQERVAAMYRRMGQDPYYYYDGLSEARKEEWRAQLGGAARYREYSYTTDNGCLGICLKGTQVGIHNGAGVGTFTVKVFDESEEFGRRFISRPYYQATPVVLWIEGPATVAVDGGDPCVLGPGRWTAYLVKSGSGKLCLVKEADQERNG